MIPKECYLAKCKLGRRGPKISPPNLNTYY